jgi:hypothetical protein
MEFEINFLTQKKSVLLAEQVNRYRLPIMVALLGVVVVLFLVFYGNVLTRKTSQVMTSGQEFLRTTVEKDRVASLANRLRELQTRRILWTAKLAGISAVIPDQVFLTSLTYEHVEAPTGGSAADDRQRAKLVLRGMVVPTIEADPAVSVQKFMEALKKNPAFLSGFENPVLVSVSNARGAEARAALEFEFHLFRQVQQ